MSEIELKKQELKALLRKRVSANIKKLRAKRSFHKFAEPIGASKQQVDFWESKENMPNLLSAFMLCEHYGVTLDQLTKEEL